MKFYFWLLSLMLLVVIAADTRAAAVGYLDVVMNGSVEKEAHPTNEVGAALYNKSGEADLETTMISVGGMFKEKLKVGAEYGFGKTSGEDLSLWTVKGGYRIVDKRAFKLDGIVAPLNIDTESSELRSLLYGMDATVYFSKKVFLTGTYVFGDATYAREGLKKDSEVPMSLLRIKLHYFIRKNIGVFAGYTMLKYEFDFVSSAGNDFGRMDVAMGGPVLGMIYKF